MPDPTEGKGLGLPGDVEPNTHLDNSYDLSKFDRVEEWQPFELIEKKEHFREFVKVNVQGHCCPCSLFLPASGHHRDTQIRRHQLTSGQIQWCKEWENSIIRN
jgi:hypothetical protein